MLTTQWCGRIGAAMTPWYRQGRMSARSPFTAPTELLIVTLSNINSGKIAVMRATNEVMRLTNGYFCGKSRFSEILPEPKQ